MVGETAAQGSPRGATSSKASSFRHRPAVRRNAVGQIIGWKEKLREVSAYSTVGPEFAWEAARRRQPIRHRLKMDCDRIARSFRKACNLPLSPWLPATSCSFYVCFKFSHDAWNLRTSSCYVAHLSPSFQPAHVLRLWRVRLAGAYLSCSKRTRLTASPEKFRHRTTVPILL
jgi:hypothetical protein